MLFERNEINWIYKSLFYWREIFKASKFICYFMIIDEVGSWFLAKKFVGKNSDYFRKLKSFFWRSINNKVFELVYGGNFFFFSENILFKFFLIDILLFTKLNRELTIFQNKIAKSQSKNSDHIFGFFCLKAFLFLNFFLLTFL
jgi:hypothetical protein